MERETNRTKSIVDLSSDWLLQFTSTDEIRRIFVCSKSSRTMFFNVTLFNGFLGELVVAASFSTISYFAWSFSEVQRNSFLDDQEEEEEENFDQNSIDDENQDQQSLIDPFSFDVLRFDQIEQTIGESIFVARQTVFQQDRTLTIVLKFLDEAQRTIVVSRTDSIQQVKHENFLDELSNGKIVRFIYQGRELDDNKTVEHFKITDQTVIHCQIADRQNETTDEFERDEIFDLSPVCLSLPQLLLVIVVLGCVWYLRIEYRVLFKPISTVLLIFVSLLCLIFLGGSCLTNAISIFHRQHSRTSVDHR